MLESLKELIFGLNEFEKAKIDDRINQAFLLVPKIKLTRLEDFEILEENIYKLKEQLRIKSSNLNRVIKSSKLISKKQVLSFIKDLENIRYEFLKQVFSQIGPTNTQQAIPTQPQPSTIQTTRAQLQPQIKKKEETKIEKILDKELENKKNKIEISEKSEIQLIDENKFTLLINNGKVPYLTIKFKEKIDLIILKNLSSLFFEIYQMHGTNIIVENNTALIIPRFQRDELINLPQIQENLEEIFKLLKQNQTLTNPNKNKSKQTLTQKIDIETKSEPKQGEKEQSNSNEYLKINDDFKKQEFQTKKYNEDSLDALLTKHQEENKPKDEPNITKPEHTTKNEIIFEKAEHKVEVEHKEPIIKSEPEIELIKEDSNEKDLLKKHQEIAKGQTQNQFSFEIYRDENIVAYFQEDSKSIGTLCLTTPSGQPIHSLSENELSYLTIFSKVFAGVLFEVAGCHGTNIIWNFSENTINIIPRLDKDGVLNMWDLNQEKPETLEKIKEKLLTTILIEQEKNKPKTPQAQNEKPKEALEKIKGESDSEKEQRAKHLLDSLRRIP